MLCGFSVLSTMTLILKLILEQNVETNANISTCVYRPWLGIGCLRFDPGTAGRIWL